MQHWQVEDLCGQSGGLTLGDLDRFMSLAEAGGPIALQWDGGGLAPGGT